MPIANISPTAAKAVRYGFVAVVVLAGFCICFTIVQRTHHNGDTARHWPIRWKPYSDVRKNSNLQRGRKVLVFVYAELNPESSVALESIDAAKAARLCNSEAYEALLLRYSDWDDPNIRSVWRDVGHTKKPFLALYSPKELPVAFDPLSGATLCR